jgi:hypothetical protein
LAVAFAVFPDPAGVETLYVVAKATFVIRADQVLTLAEPQIPVCQADAYYGEPECSSLKHANELLLAKPGTDVVVAGHGWAPHGRAAPHSAVRVKVAERDKTVAIFGDRTWRRGGGLSSPQPFEKMPLVYERAYGGRHKLASTGAVLAEPSNPAGCGFLGRRSPDELIGAPVPNIEDPRALITRLGDTPPPAGLGPIAPGWLPRRSFVGTYDDKWQKTRAPYLPHDFDVRFFNVATPELTFPRYLVGGEPVQLLGVSPEGPYNFDLPRLAVKVEILINGSTSTPPAHLDTVLFAPDDRAMCLTWRAVLPCDKSVLRVKQINVDVNGLAT